MARRGQLEIIFGCMYSGKSTELVRRIRRYISIGKRCMLINHDIDTRGKNEVLCHTRDRMDAVKASSFKNIEFPDDVDVVGIDEAQFFTDLFDTSTHMPCPALVALLNKGVTVIVAGLHADFRARPFSSLVGLIPFASSIEFKTALCSVCKDGTPASFSKKISGSVDQRIESGAGDKYRAVCWTHFFA